MVVVHVIVGDVFAGGVGTVVRTLIAEQERCGLKTALITSAESCQPFCDWCVSRGLKTAVYQTNARRLPTLFGCVSKNVYVQIIKDFASEQIVFHYHNPIAFGLLSFIPKEKKVCTIHGILENVTSKRASIYIFQKTIKRMIQNEVAVIGCSGVVARHYSNLLKTKHIKGILNGVESTPKSDNKYIADNGKIHIGFASYIDELKGWRVLAEAYSCLPTQLRNSCDLLFAGQIADVDKADFETFVRSNSDVTYIGYVNDIQEAFLPYLDILVLPSRTEGMPMIILEALQAGTCIVCTPVGGIPEIVEDGVSGWFIERNVESLRDKLSFLTQNPDILVSTRKQAYERYFKLGSSSVMTQQYLEVYREIFTSK